MLNLNILSVLCLFYTTNIQKEKTSCFSGGRFGCRFLYDVNVTACKIYKLYQSFNFLQNVIKMQTIIQTNIHFQISIINSVMENLYLEDILGAIMNF